VAFKDAFFEESSYSLCIIMEMQMEEICNLKLTILRRRQIYDEETCGEYFSYGAWPISSA